MPPEQLTSGPGYDYQPDCSHDGRWVAYVTYLHDALELQVLDLETKQSHQLTSGGAVNLEPRFSPDGKHLAFVSTSYNGRFHIFVGDFNNGELTGVQRLTGETRSSLPRFYYSEVDHEISPAWSPDGKDVIFVSNRGHIYGTGSFWRMRAERGAEPHEIHYEETAWKARPEFSPDGKRIAYASYLGGQWHQLWLMPSQGGDPFPISYGDFDNTNPRWSPDGTRIAFISNRSGNTSLWVQEVLGGVQWPVVAKTKRYLKQMGHLNITILDPSGKPTPARVSVTGEDQRAYAPDDAWMHAEDNFVRAERPFEPHYFHTTGQSELTVPLGRVQVEVTKGFEYRVASETVNCGPDARLVIHLKRLQAPDDAHSRLVSADLHVHMNYGGAYRNTPGAPHRTARGLRICSLSRISSSTRSSGFPTLLPSALRPTRRQPRTTGCSRDRSFTLHFGGISACCISLAIFCCQITPHTAAPPQRASFPPMRSSQISLISSRLSSAMHIPSISRWIPKRTPRSPTENRSTKHSSCPST